VKWSWRVKRELRNRKLRTLSLLRRTAQPTASHITDCCCWDWTETLADCTFNCWWRTMKPLSSAVTCYVSRSTNRDCHTLECYREIHFLTYSHIAQRLHKQRTFSRHNEVKCSTYCISRVAINEDGRHEYQAFVCEDVAISFNKLLLLCLFPKHYTSAYSILLSPSWETESSLAGKEIYWVLWDSKVHYIPPLNYLKPL
jgi:hypothetical protein